MSFDVSNFELPRVWAIDKKNDVLFNVDGTIAFRRWNQKAHAMEIHLSMSRLEAEKLLLCLQAAQQSAQADVNYCYGPNNHLLKDANFFTPSNKACTRQGQVAPQFDNFE